MANEEQDSNATVENNPPNEVQPAEEEENHIPETCGWLMKRSKISHKWKKQWFQLKNTDLLYGNEEGVSLFWVVCGTAELNVECYAWQQNQRQQGDHLIRH